MKSRKINFVINFGIILMLILCFFSTSVQATGKTEVEQKTLDQMTTEAKNFIAQGEKGQAINNNDVKKVIIPIAQALVAIATVILLVVTIFMGVKYITCQSADQKAKLKTQLIGLGVSTAVIFGAQIIWSTLYEVMKNV